VSLGVGTGDKDLRIIRHLKNLKGEQDKLFYVAVDISSEMLQLVLREMESEDQAGQPDLTLLVQLDFFEEGNIQQLRKLLDDVLGEQPTMFSLLGNTVANFEDDAALLRMLANHLVRPQDRLLLEVATTDKVEPDAVNAARKEYQDSPDFKRFVTSVLTQHTDLHVNPSSVQVAGTQDTDNRAIRIETIYRNHMGEVLVTIPDGRDPITFPNNDSIRLYLSRKYTEPGIAKLINDCGFSGSDPVREFFRLPHPYRFGVYLFLLGRSS
jgi:uncharacterized SAM-dependent methyltransferase